MKTNTNKILGLLVLMVLTAFFLMTTGMAAAEEGDGEEWEGQNAAQTAHRDNLAATVPQSLPEGSDTDLEEAWDAVTELEEGGIPQPGDEGYEDYMTARETLAELLGEEIGKMRDEGMGWGQIAHEFGIHPGVLGLGHGKKLGYTDTVQTTARNRRGGLGLGHGVTPDGEPIIGAGLGAQGKGKGKGKGNDHGKGKGKGKGKGPK